MNFRKIVGFIVAVLAFLGVVLLLGKFLESVMGYNVGSVNPLLRLLVIFVGLTAAFTVYYLIKGKEPEIKEKQGITSDEISKKLEEKRETRKEN